jgi:hypothetical protein
MKCDSRASFLAHTFVSPYLRGKSKARVTTYEGFNLQTCASGLNSIVSCANLVMMESFNGSCFGHVLSKVCQYATTDNKVAMDCLTHLYKSQS